MALKREGSVRKAAIGCSACVRPGVEQLLARIEKFDRAQNVFLNGMWGTLRCA